MSRKQKLQHILDKLKSWSESSGDNMLDQHITELENEINASFDAAGDSDDTGGSTPPPEKGRG
jgi:hypothetical protein